MRDAATIPNLKKESDKENCSKILNYLEHVKPAWTEKYVD
jgi:hypothetical protein